MPAARRKTTVLTKAQRLRREQAIIRDLKGGKLSYRQIAAKHGVSLPTVNSKARKAKIRRSRSGPGSTRTVARKTTRRPTTMRAKSRPTARKKTTRKTTRRPATTTWASPRSVSRFENAFRELVMSYYPNMPLKSFERLNRAVTKALK